MHLLGIGSGLDRGDAFLLGGEHESL